ncbi:hypothetical protein GCM10023189_53160 [Nibrella saemangeumensis]|uniref:Lipocalin-like domain-containing protein n=1 Tax=Nibrella saemangeumensis TaxID=1084526 RepID=A0ABP8NMD3_9BACT
MKKSLFATLLSILVIGILAVGCKKPAPPPVSERIAKNWTARIVQENSTTVFTRGGTNNAKPGYSNFRIDLSTATATLREVDNNTFTGQWEVQGENKLILKNLTPQPTGTNGTIEFTIDSISDTELKLTRTTASQKTGGTMNVYTLSNP